MIKIKKLFIFFVLFSMNNVWATNIFKVNNVYMSFKVGEVNARKGPGSEFPLIYTYKLKGMPIKVLGEFDNFYKIQDKDNDISWVAKHLVSKTKTLITISDLSFIYSSNNIKKSYVKLKVEKNVSLQLIKCKNTMCKVKIKKIKGWVNMSDVWGYQNIDK